MRLTLLQLRFWDSLGRCSCGRDPRASTSAKTSTHVSLLGPIFTLFLTHHGTGLKSPRPPDPAAGVQPTRSLEPPVGQWEGEGLWDPDGLPGCSAWQVSLNSEAFVFPREALGLASQPPQKRGDQPGGIPVSHCRGLLACEKQDPREDGAQKAPAGPQGSLSRHLLLDRAAGRVCNCPAPTPRALPLSESNSQPPASLPPVAHALATMSGTGPPDHGRTDSLWNPGPALAPEPQMGKASLLCPGRRGTPAVQPGGPHAHPQGLL